MFEFEDTIKSPGSYQYYGYTIIVKEGNRVSIKDNMNTGRLLIVDEYIQTRQELDYLIRTINNAR